MTKHMGPWKVAYWQGYLGVIGPDGLPVTTNMENAHLIAAAPDMYEALKIAERAIDDCLGGRSHLHYQELGQVRTVIAKVEGRS